ncbi:respiratory chain complex I subunit 1 family protein [Campylobacter hyointestinalis]|uniref:Hydrogenase n=1 Tax=Campylobacter hyointestinalis subsp. hyointestinalis TaxID=91352 RepID=A0A855N6Q3_CAMHY|nr:NADH-quinone oxidoreductase subunit H [Campylobacter hyointestinalis]ANE31858.1 hydrogenase-4, component C [Campylobacter hyointestinalis subsp. hyointestinalis LMG 9260]KEA44159.1 hydrogenase [Campylobacter hyointestinalis subsp. hyointestinalis]PPB57113.1 hydrogenase [Campylobacter hyointestinalis subsp. hyointestinalis]PPB64337.1 hydrogenase [Campylobacter hyointestinalis subsp. hyointestinalis]PPB72030.1 hydrogenase [Campylobacter hyointestinalis subsp. hyointestinalis]
MEAALLMILQLFVALALTPLFDGIARNLRGKIQSRKSSPLLQTYYDIFKLLKRSRTIPNCVHWFFKFSPYMLFSVTALLVMIMPITYGGLANAGAISDIIVVVYLVAFFRFIFGIASLDSANPYAGVGASRESFIAIYIEPIMIICLIVVASLAKTTNLPTIKELVSSGEVGYASASYALSSVAFLWAMYVETGRKPFDLAEAEQEVQEGVIGEYSGRDLALVEMALMLKQFAMISFFIVVFIPLGFTNPLLSLISHLILVGLFYIGAILIDNFGPRFRILTSLKFNSACILLISLISLSLYVVGV